MKIFEVNGYWKDDKSEFNNYLISEFHDLPDGFTDDDIFFYGLSESDIREAIDAGEGTGQEFVITELVFQYEHDEQPVNELLDALLAIEHIAMHKEVLSDTLETDMERKFHEALMKIYRLAHVARKPRCLDVHDDWVEELNRTIKIAKL